jgi:hypothetical protein
MIQPIKQFRVTSLTVQGFKGYQEAHSFDFGDMNVITGHMGVGKSSIADAIAYAITGVTFFGSAKIDTLYHTGSRELSVDLGFEDGSGATRRLIRRRVNDVTDLTLDGVKITQRDLTLLFGEKDLFLSMFNPLYFIEVLGSKGRDLLERYLPDIPRDTILEGLNAEDRQQLAGYDFLSADAFAKTVREDLSQLERDLIYTQGQCDLLESQTLERDTSLKEKQAAYQEAAARVNELEARRTTGFQGTDLKERLTDLYAKHEQLLREPPETPDTRQLDEEIQTTTAALEQRRAEVYQSKYAQALADTQAKINTLGQEVQRQKRIIAGLKPGVKCPMCRQTVTAATLPAVRKEFEDSLRQLCAQGTDATGQLKQLQELDAKAKEVFEQFRADDTASGEAKLAELTVQRSQAVEKAKADNAQRSQAAAALRSEIQSIELDLDCGMLSPEDAEELHRLRETVEKLGSEISVLSTDSQEAPGRREQLEETIQQTKTQMTEKKKLLSALALYISRRVELTFSKLQMNRVSICLYEVVKTTGELKNVFKFNYEDRPYLCLSRSEQIRAGLEVTELVKHLAGVNFPVFIDNTESVPVIDNVRPSGQVFIAKVVKGAQLQVQASNNAVGAKAA